MATSADRGFIEQLREMRATRTQQLRQGNQEAALLNRQITSLNNLDKTMRAVLKTQNLSASSLKDINTKQNNMIRQSDQMSKSISNLSTSITKSVSSLASAAVKGTGSAVGSAGGAVVGAASSVASGVASSLAKALPFAIAGVVGKMFVYDKMDDSTKKELGESFSRLMKSIFGDVDTSSFGKVVKPITKEIGIVFGALGDTLGGVTEQITKLVKKIEDMDFKRVSEALDSVSKTVLGIINNPELKYYIDKGIAANKAAGKMAEYIPEDRSAVVSATVGAGALAYGAVKGSQKIAAGTSQAQPVAQAATSAATASRLSTATVSRNLTDKEIKVMQKSLEAMKKFKLGKGAIALLVGRLAALSELGMISGGAKFLTALKNYKAGNVATAALSGVAVAITVFTIQMINEQIDTMVMNGIVSQGDGEWLKGYLQSEEISSLVGSIVFGTAGFVGGAFAGPIGSVGLGIAGTISGGSVGADVGRSGYEFFNPMPDTLKSTDYEQKTNNILKQQYYNQSQLRNNQNDSRRFDRAEAAKPQGALTPNSASHSTSAMDIVGMSEGGAAGYDAIYGFSGPGGDPSIPRSHGGKNLSQLTIGEVIAIGKSRGKNRGALGKYQFMPTVLEFLLAPAKLTKNDIFSPENQDHLYRVFTQLNGMELKKRGIELTAENLHLAHAVGAKGAAKLLKADPNAIAADVLGFEVGSAARDTNPQLEKPTSEYIASITGKYQNGNISTSQTSIAQAAISAPMTVTSVADNYARRKKEAKEAEKYEEGSDSFVGPLLKETKQSPSQFAGMSIKQFTSDFAKTTQDLTNVFQEIFALQNTQPASMISNDQSTNINQVNSGGGGGGPSISSVISGSMADRNWQFNALAGSSTA
jgi:hypothetical protein